MNIDFRYRPIEINKKVTSINIEDFPIEIDGDSFYRLLSITIV